MDDLVAFLKARLDEDEHTAKMAAEDASASANWHVDATYLHSGHAGISGENGEVIVYDEGTPTLEEAAHIARHDPARVLREVEAKRRMLAKHGECSCPEKLWLAAVYSDHPGYRPEWSADHGITSPPS